MFFQANNIKDKLNSKKRIILICSLFLISQYFTLFHENELTTDTLFKLFNASISITFVVVVSKYFSQWKSGTITLIGTSSMAIYLLHILAGSSIRIGLQKVSKINAFEVHLIVGVLAGIFIPIVLVFLSKKLAVPYIESAPICTLLNKERR